MKRLLLAGMLISSLPLNSRAQFTPFMAPPFRAQMGAVVKFSAFFYTGGPGVFIFVPEAGLSVHPMKINGGDATIEILVTTDSIGCWRPHWIATFDSSGREIGGFCVCQGVFYDGGVIGAPKVFAYPSDTETEKLDIGRILTNDSSVLSFYVQVPHSFATYRKFALAKLQAPFTFLDTVPLSYPLCSGMEFPTRVLFRPSAIGKYRDTIMLDDPVANLSIPLILLGEGVAASVPENPAASELRIYPNPADREATVALGAGEMQMVTIYNVMGDAVMRIPENGEDYRTLNTSSLPSGLYYVEAVTKQGVYRERIVISH